MAYVLEKIIVTQTVETDGRIELNGLPVQVGDVVRVTITRMEASETAKHWPSGQDWLDSDMVGMWADRDDMVDPVAWVNERRREEDNRSGLVDRPD